MLGLRHYQFRQMLKSMAELYTNVTVIEVHTSNCTIMTYISYRDIYIYIYKSWHNMMYGFYTHISSIYNISMIYYHTNLFSGRWGVHDADMQPLWATEHSSRRQVFILLIISYSRHFLILLIFKLIITFICMSSLITNHYKYCKSHHLILIMSGIVIALSSSLLSLSLLKLSSS